MASLTVANVPERTERHLRCQSPLPRGVMDLSNCSPSYGSLRASQHHLLATKAHHQVTVVTVITLALLLCFPLPDAARCCTALTHGLPIVSVITSSLHYLLLPLRQVKAACAAQTTGRHTICSETSFICATHIGATTTARRRTNSFVCS